MITVIHTHTRMLLQTRKGKRRVQRVIDCEVRGKTGKLVEPVDAFYFAGLDAPHYPMPATTDNAETATNWLHLVLCPFVYSDKYRQGGRPVPCPVCIDRFLDGLE